MNSIITWHKLIHILISWRWRLKREYYQHEPRWGSQRYTPRVWVFLDLVVPLTSVSLKDFYWLESWLVNLPRTLTYPLKKQELTAVVPLLRNQRLHSKNLHRFPIARTFETFLSWVGKSYPPVNWHSHGKSPFSIGNTSSKGPFSIAMLVYRRVNLLFKGP